MILAMARRQSHLSTQCRLDRLSPVASRFVAVILSWALSIGPAIAQTSGGAARPTDSPPKAAASATTTIRPDKGRARAAFQAGRASEQLSEWKAAFAAYSEAAAYDPSNREYAILKEHSRFQVIQGFVDSAERQAVSGDLSSARALLQQALEIDPNYAVAQERLAELTQEPIEAEPGKVPRLAGLPRLNLKPGNRAFDYRGTTRGAYEEIAKQFGVTVVFDGDLADRQVQFQVPSVDFDTAVMVLSRQTRTFTRVVDTHTMFVTDDSPQKVREYALEVEKELVLPAAVTTDEMNETVRMIREMTGITRTQLNTSTRTLTVRSTEQNVALAQTILQQIEQPHGELMLEIEILEVDRDAAHQLGIVPPSSSSVFILTLPEIRQLQAAQNNGTLIQILQSIFGSGAVSSATGAALPSLIAFGGGKTIFLATMPGVSADFAQTLSAVRGAQRILLRAQDAKPATFFVGDRFPISFGLLSSDLSPTSTALTQTLQGLLAGSLPRTDYTVGNAPVSVAIADFNGDGHPDLAVANQTDGTVSILLGNGDGTFAAQTTVTLPAGTAKVSPSALATGDFDGDGNLDLAVTDSANNDVVILFGDGKGNFAPSTAAASYATGTTPVALLVSDFNGDSIPDLAVVDQGVSGSAGSVSILLGNTTRGKTNTFLPKTDYPVGKTPTAIASGVFFTNGFTSLAVTNEADNTVSILLGQGTNGVANGTFMAPTQSPFSTGTGPAGIAVADFNGDGKPDLAITHTTDTSGNSVSILKGNGDGTFGTATEFPAGSGPVGIVAANFTGTNTDLAVADKSGNNVDILVGNGDGTFATPISLATQNSPVALAAADLTGSGAQDLVTADNGTNQVTVYLNTLLSSSTSPGTQTAYPSAEYVDLGLKVKATPHLHANDEVTLQLEFDIKSLTGSSVNGIPVLSNRNIEQTIRLRENETSVLSGIIEKNESRTLSGLPWTSTEPGIGLLTGEDTTNNQQTETLILVTPRAVRLPPHDVPAIYAGRGEPSTPPAPLVPITPGVQPPGAQPGVGLPPQPGQGLREPLRPVPPPGGPPFQPPGVPPPGQNPGEQSPQQPPGRPPQ
jgi:type II secretory pathway component GspD/PulD (secretin)